MLWDDIGGHHVGAIRHKPPAGHPYRPWCTKMQSQLSRLRGRTRVMVPQDMSIWLWSRKPRRYKTTDNIGLTLRLSTTGNNKSPLQDGIPLLAIATHNPEVTSTNYDIFVSLRSFQLLTPTKFLQSQASVTYWRTGHGQVGYGHINSMFSVNTDGLLVRRFCIDGALRILVSEFLCQGIHNLSRRSLFGRHSSDRHMYDTLARKFY